MRLILQRYLGFNFVLPLTLSTLFFVSFLLTFQLFRVTKILASKDVPFIAVLELMGHIAVTFLPIGVPLSVLFATIYTYGKLGQDSELIAMRSLGITKFKLFAPILFLSFFIAGALFGLNQNLIPYSNQQFRLAMNALTSKGLLSDIKKGQFFSEIPGVLMFTRDVQDDDLTDVFLRIENSSGQFQSIHAKRAKIQKGQETQWGSSSMSMIFFDGNMAKFSQNGERIEKVIFEKYYMPVTTAEVSLDFAPKETMRSSNELIQVIKEWDKEKKSLQELFQIKVELYNRINSPLLVLVFAFIGMGVGVQRARGKNQNTATMSLGVLLIYYALFFTGLNFSKQGIILPELAVFIPTLIILGLGLVFYRRLDWVV